MNKQTGFTLIELVIVIVILGILAATALPRFANLSGDARAAKVDGVLGAVKSAANIAHATQLARGDSGSTAVVLEGANVTMVNGYPTADVTGILAATQLDTTTDGVTLDTSSAGTAAGDILLVQVNGAQSLATCAVSYTAPAANTPPSYAAPKGGC